MNELKFLPVTIQRVLSLCDVKCSLGNDLVITDFGGIPLPKETRYMECIFVGLCTGGEGRYTVGDVEHKVKPNDIIIVGEGQVLGDIRATKDLEGDTLLISHDFLYDVIHEVRDVSNLFVYSRERPVFSVTDREVEMFKEYISILKAKIADNNHRFRREIAGTLLATMIYDLCNASNHSQAEDSGLSRSQVTFEKYIHLVEQHFRHERSIAWYSEQLGISPKTLLETTKRVSQRTPTDWLDIYTTQEIRLLLRHTTKSVGEIAKELHFGTQSSMGKFFKMHTGISPLSYRKQPNISNGTLPEAPATT